METTRMSDREFSGIERAVLDLLRDGSPRTVDDIAGALPGDCFAQVFLTIDRLSREGIVKLLRSHVSYRVALTN